MFLNRLVSPRLQVQQVLQLSKSPLLDSFFNSLPPYFGLNFKLPEEIAELKLTEAVSILRNIHKDTDRILSDFSQPGKINLKEFMERNYMFNIPLEKFSFLTGKQQYGYAPTELANKKNN